MKKMVHLLVVGMLLTAGLFINSIDTVKASDFSEWEILDGDNLTIDSYFYGTTGIRTPGPFLQGINFRMRPSPGTSSECDRLYAAGGVGDDFTPYALYAFTNEGSESWNSPFQTDSRITSKVHVNNFGSESNVAEADLRVMFGCDNGKFYILKDSFIDANFPITPTGPNVWSTQLDGTVIGMSYYDQRGVNQTELTSNPGNETEITNWFAENPFNNYDLIFVSTATGTLYAFAGPVRELNPVTETYNDTLPTMLWSNSISNTESLNSPAVSDNGQYVFVGTSDGLLYGLDSATGSLIPDWSTPYRVSETHWSTSPVTVGNPPLVYAATENGLVHCVNGLNGQAKEGWTHIENGDTEESGLLLENEMGIDGGRLTEIYVLPGGSYVLVGSDSGFAYSVLTNPVHISYAFDTRIGSQDTEVQVAPYFDWRFTGYLFVIARHLNDTATDPSDDFSIVNCLSSPGNESIIWRLGVNGVIAAPPIAYINNDHVGNKADIVFATVFFESDATANGGRMYSYSASGRCIINPISYKDEILNANLYIIIGITTIIVIAVIASYTIVHIRRKRKM